MPTVSNIGVPVVNTPTEANRPAPAQTARQPGDAPVIDPAAQPKFVDRRKNPERRKAAKKPLLDTRHRTDRRRTGRFEVKI